MRFLSCSRSFRLLSIAAAACFRNSSFRARTNAVRAVRAASVRSCGRFCSILPTSYLPRVWIGSGRRRPGHHPCPPGGPGSLRLHALGIPVLVAWSCSYFAIWPKKAAMASAATLPDAATVIARTGRLRDEACELVAFERRGKHDRRLARFRPPAGTPRSDTVWPALEGILLAAEYTIGGARSPSPGPCRRDYWRASRRALAETNLVRGIPRDSTPSGLSVRPNATRR